MNKDEYLSTGILILNRLKKEREQIEAIKLEKLLVETRLREAQECLIECQQGFDEIQIGKSIREYKQVQVETKKRVLIKILNNLSIDPNDMYVKHLMENKLIKLLKRENGSMLIYKDMIREELRIDVIIFNKEWQRSICKKTDLEIHDYYRNKYHIDDHNITRIESLGNLKPYSKLPWYDFPFNTTIITVLSWLSPLNLLPSMMQGSIWNFYFLIFVLFYVGIIIMLFFSKPWLQELNFIKIYEQQVKMIIIIILRIISIFFVLLLFAITIGTGIIVSLSTISVSYRLMIIHLVLVQLLAIILLILYLLLETKGIKKMWYLYVDKCKNEEKYYRHTQWFIGTAVLNVVGNKISDLDL